MINVYSRFRFLRNGLAREGRPAEDQKIGTVVSEARLCPDLFSGTGNVLTVPG
jgi:hypothetical protein